MDRLAAVNLAAYSRPPAFVTLTYPNEFPKAPETYKAHARACIRRLWRQFGKMAVVWRLEFQKRGAPHFHLLVWEPPERKALKKYLLRAWYNICGTGDRKHLYRGVDVRQVEGWHGLRAYLAKYVAKLDGEKYDASSPPGRWWGVEGGSLLVSSPVAINLDDWRSGFRIRRALRRYAGVRHPIYYQLQGASAYAPDDLLPLLLRWVRPPPTSQRGGRPGLRSGRLPSRPSPLTSQT